MKALLPLAALAVTGCSTAPPPGAPAASPTIVSLNPCTDAILAEVAAPGQLLAISHYSHDPRSSSMEPAQARRFRSIGGTAEEVAALAPDIVVGSSFMPPATRAALERMGMRVESFGIAASVEDSEAQIRRLAQIAGHPGQGAALIRRIENSLTAPDGPPVQAALWQAGGIVPGKATLVADLLRRAGFASWSEARGMAQGSYLRLEQIAADPPEVLLVAGSERAQHHPLLAELPGTHVTRFDTTLTYCGGPSIPRAMQRLRAIRREAA